MVENIRQIHSIGGDTFEQIVSADRCAGMTARGLEVVGLTDAGDGYCMQRPQPPAGHLLATFGGAGEIWVDGQWQTCSAGHAYISPPLAPSAFRTVRRRRWQFAWVFIVAKPGMPSPVAGVASSVTSVDPRLLKNAIEGLYLESVASIASERLDAWADLVAGYAREVLAPTGLSDPLWQLWSDVDRALSDPWTLARLSARAAVQPETLRRLCVRSTGMSPMRHVTQLRMRRAEALLRFTNEKLFAIARQTGYSNTFAFSTAFRRWKGRPPKQCRGLDQGS